VHFRLMLFASMSWMRLFEATPLTCGSSHYNKLCSVKY